MEQVDEEGNIVWERFETTPGRVKLGAMLPLNTKAPFSLINRSTSSFGLQVNRLQPNSRGEVQVRLENAAFDDLVAWLHQMEYRESLIVQEVSITPGGGSGRVNATVRLAQAS